MKWSHRYDRYIVTRLQPCTAAGVEIIETECAGLRRYIFKDFEG